MPWKQGYTISDERTLDHVEWPDAARAAAVITVDLGPECGPDGITARDLESEDTEYGMRVGLDRVLDLLERHGVTATFAVPAAVAETWPDRIREIAARGHEIAAHGDRHENPSKLARAEEAQRMTRATDTLAAVAGARPAGWYSLPRPGDRYAGGALSPHTIDLLIDAGYTYFGNGLADDIPHYWVTDAAAHRCLLTLPYYYHSDDQFFLMFPTPGRGSALERPAPLRANWLGELEAARAFGRCFAMTIHPRLIAWGGRLTLLETILTRLKDGASVWTGTALACARWFAARCPASTALRLEPSIWQDHPGSLS
ncbi:MAG TPA: polysaccharide deacetylase family protein [Candidatus Methylomirabilis sp.]|nr:polysaccharide deacetylase family protein [Candidatus Methylomirabilis sp.]